MSYVDVYRMWFTNDNGDDVIIHISDTASGIGTSTFHDMKDASGEWLTVSARVSSANDGEDKTSIVRSTRFSCSFVSTTTYNVDFFVSGEDNRWLVEVFLLSPSNQPVFTGYLVPDGAKDIFIDHELFGVELTASDFLQSLSEVPLRKPDGSVPKGKFTLIEFISWSLQKTFLQLPIQVVYSLREETHNGLDDCFLKMISQEALTYETDINERENCLSVIQKILLGCFITQVNSQWWIVRVDEMDNTPYRIYSFSYDGIYQSTTTADYLKKIGINETINIVNEDASIFPERQIKYAKQTFKFETWQEFICNITYTRGTLNGSITVPTGYEAYSPVECWLNGKNPDGSVINTAVDVPGYVRKKKENGYETERILVLPKLPAPSSVHYFMSEGVDVNVGDKFRFSVDRKLDTDHTGSGTTHDSIFKIRLRGDDGTYWSMIGNSTSGTVGSWKQGTGGFPVQHFDWAYQTANEDETQWFTHSVEVQPVPRTGTIEIMLFQSDVYGLVNDTYFSNIQFDYIPIIDGVYQQVTGQYHKVSNTDNRKANKDEEIYISDAVSPNWKGVLFKYDTGFYKLVKWVYDFRYGPTGALGLDKFGAYHDFALWNQYNRTIRKIQPNLKGLDTNTGVIPSFIYKFQFTDPSTATDNKLFQMLNFDMDLASCEWSGTFADVFETVKDFSSDHEFKYTTK